MFTSDKEFNTFYLKQKMPFKRMFRNTGIGTKGIQELYKKNLFILTENFERLQFELALDKKQVLMALGKRDGAEILQSRGKAIPDVLKNKGEIENKLNELIPIGTENKITQTFNQKIITAEGIFKKRDRIRRIVFIGLGIIILTIAVYGLTRS